MSVYGRKFDPTRVMQLGQRYEGGVFWEHPLWNSVMSDAAGLMVLSICAIPSGLLMPQRHALSVLKPG